MGEKRRFMRFNVFLDALCRSNETKKKVKVSNFSKDGIGLLSEEIFNRGDEVEVEMTIPGDNLPVVIEGQIAWASGSTDEENEYKGGLKFNKINNDDKSRILEYIYQNWIMPVKEK